MGEPLLAVRRLHARYGAVEAVRGIDLTVEVGEVVVVLGSNGAGKTTLARAVSGLVTTTGSIRLAGRELVGLAPHRIARLGVAHVPQGRGTFGALRVDDNLTLGAYQRRDRAAVEADRERWYATFSALAARREQPAASLSGGEQQMLALARALMGRPRLLVLDEPSLGLAPRVVADLFVHLAAPSRGEGTAVLMVEQNADLALGLGDRGYVLEAGTVVAAGPVATLRRDPALLRAYLGA